ncbi:MAG: hypothetical protein AAFZ65_09935, partial [Planctomycetota bacterium]
ADARVKAASATPSTAVGSTVAESPAEAGRTAREQFLVEATQERGGLLSGDLTQYPAWLQGLVWIGVLAGTGAIAWGMLKLMGG